MKYLVIALKPETKDEPAYFRLETLLPNFFDHEAIALSASQQFLYLHILAEDLDAAREFLKIHDVSLSADMIPDNIDKLMKARLNHIVLEVPDDFEESMEILKVMTRAYLCQPEGYIHQAINAELDKAEAELECADEQVRMADPTQEEAMEKWVVLRKLAIKRVDQLRERLDALIHAPFLAFQRVAVAQKVENEEHEEKAMEMHTFFSQSINLFRGSDEDVELSDYANSGTVVRPKV